MKPVHPLKVVAVIAILLVAAIVLSQVLGPSDALEKCQLTHSFDTCAESLF